MSTEQMRGEFEQAMKDRLGDVVDLSRAINGGGEYMQWDANIAWIMFQASRAALVVKLPTQEKYDDPLSAHNAINDCKGILRAAGITVTEG